MAQDVPHAATQRHLLPSHPPCQEKKLKPSAPIMEHPVCDVTIGAYITLIIKTKHHRREYGTGCNPSGPYTLHE